MPNLAESYGLALHQATTERENTESGKTIDAFVALLKERNQLYLAPKIFEAYERAARKAEGIEKLSFTSADEVKEADRARIAEALKGSIGAPIEIDWSVDPSLIAGAVVRYADRLLDASVKGKLARLKQQLA